MHAGVAAAEVAAVRRLSRTGLQGKRFLTFGFEVQPLEWDREAPVTS